jgi:hypothetical protein
VLDYLRVNAVDGLSPLTLEVYDGIQLEHVHLTRHGGRRVFMNNPGQGRDLQPDDTVYDGLVGIYRDLVRDKSLLKVEYPNAPRLKIELPEEKLPVTTLWGDGERILVRSRPPGYSHDAWFTVTGERAEGELPVIPSARDPLMPIPAGALFSGDIGVGEHPKTKKLGLWRGAGIGGDWIADGRYASPVLSEDHSWVVVSRALGPSWAQPNDVVRIALDSKKLIAIDLPPADDLSVIARLPTTGQIVLQRQQSPSAPGVKPVSGPEKAEYHLLDAKTGKLEGVTGEFSPLEHQTWRPLQ